MCSCFMSQRSYLSSIFLLNVYSRLSSKLSFFLWAGNEILLSPIVAINRIWLEQHRTHVLRPKPISLQYRKERKNKYSAKRSIPPPPPTKILFSSVADTDLELRRVGEGGRRLFCLLCRLFIFLWFLLLLLKLRGRGERPLGLGPSPRSAIDPVLEPFGNFISC